MSNILYSLKQLYVHDIVRIHAGREIKADGGCQNGAPERIRTSGLSLRRAALYPAELRAQCDVRSISTIFRSSGMDRYPYPEGLFPQGQSSSLGGHLR